MNVEGMRRRGVDTDVINRLREAYKTVYRRGLTLDQAIAELDQNMKMAVLKLIRF